MVLGMNRVQKRKKLLKKGQKTRNSWKNKEIEI